MNGRDSPAQATQKETPGAAKRSPGRRSCKGIAQEKPWKNIKFQNAIFLNYQTAADNKQGLNHDYEVWLEKLAPHAPTSQYHHSQTGKDNADAHMERQIMGYELVFAITKGKLDFGTLEQIFAGSSTVAAANACW